MLKIRLCGGNAVVGDVAANVARAAACVRAASADVQLIVMPECFVSGYPAEDLLLNDAFIQRVHAGLDALAELAETPLLIGSPYLHAGCLYNAALLLHAGHVTPVAFKQKLPNDSVFDEPRVFTSGPPAKTFQVAGIACGVLICEDMWHAEPAAALVADGAQLLLSLNASPFARGKPLRRRRIMQARARETGLPLAAVFLNGGQDELYFDGGNAAFNPDGSVVMQAPHNRESVDDLQLTPIGFLPAHVEPLPDDLSGVYAACVGALRDYVRKNGFSSVVLGVSGGMDSALTALIAVDALGAASVSAVLLPSRFTSPESMIDARALVQNLGIAHEVIDIEPAVDALRAALGGTHGLTDENLQARTRGVLLSARSNASGALLLTTGNKSELAVGYATLYGDMCGAYNVLKDLYKTDVYALGRHRDTTSALIPERIFYKAPTAELRNDQKDSDALPPYDVLDPILRHLVDEAGDARAFADPIAAGRIERMLHAAEYKRRQAAPGVRLSNKAFGRDRRYPLTHLFRSYEV